MLHVTTLHCWHRRSPDGAADELVDLRASGTVLAALPHRRCRLAAGMCQATPAHRSNDRRTLHGTGLHPCCSASPAAAQATASTCWAACQALAALLHSALLPQHQYSCTSSVQDVYPLDIWYQPAFQHAMSTA